MAVDLPRIRSARKSGQESFRSGDRPLGPKLIDFWGWMASDLVSNATRGVLAEFLVAVALRIPLDGVRDEWATYDLLTPDGLKVEVKASAYIQAWFQKRYSDIVFGVQKKRAYSPDTNELEKTPRRHAEVYVFAVHKHRDQATINPLEVDQWEFYVLRTAVLDSRKRSQHSITLRSLEKLAGPPVSFQSLAEKVREAGGKA